MNITDLLSNSTMLVEANILNAKDPHDGHSIHEFLDFYAKQLANAPSKKMFIKKITKFLINEPKYHFAVRELPAGAPEWAQKAMAEKDLFAFKPDDQLKDACEHLTHYVIALEQDSAQTEDRNKQVNANKELQAFPKAESLEMLAQKSQDYFKAGAKDDQKSTEGMKQIFEIKGFKWYKLEDAAAFRREGKVLQNCIGSMYTAEKCKQAGTSILILRTPKNQTVVATRIHNGDNQLQEMKGKNNKPPIPIYMPPVAGLINKFKLDLSRGARNDVLNAGYFYHEGKLLTRPQAMKQMVHFKNITNIGHGLKLTTPIYDESDYDSKELIAGIFGDLGVHSYRMNNVKIYVASMSDGTPILIGSVDSNKKLINLKTYFEDKHHDVSILAERVEQEKHKAYLTEFVESLVRHDLINDIGSSPERHVFWEAGLKWDKEEKQLSDRTASGRYETEKDHHGWDVYTGAELENLMKVMKSGSDFARTYPSVVTKTAYVALEDKPTGRNNNEHITYLVARVDEDDKGRFYTVHSNAVHASGIGFRKEISRNHGGGAHVEELTKNKKSIDSIVALARTRHFKIPLAVRMRLGILGEEPDQYNLHIPKWEDLKAGDVKGQKMDLSHMRDADRFRALYSVLTGDFKSKSSWNKDRFGIHSQVKNHIGAGNRLDSDENYPVGEKGDEDEFMSTMHNDIHGNIDALYKVDVGWGVDKKHGILLIASKGVIKKLDQDTEAHKWQGWDDYNKVADQVNEFAKEHKMKFAPKAIVTTRRSGVEFRIGKDGYLDTIGRQKSAELKRKKKKEGTDELKFKDGWTLSRMDPDVQSKWMRQDLQDSVRGQGWLLKDNEGANKAIFMVLHNRPLRMFFKQKNVEDPNKLPTSSWVNKSYLKYMKGAMETLGWKDPNTGALKSETGKIEHSLWDFLTKIDTHADLSDSVHDRSRKDRLKQSIGWVNKPVKWDAKHMGLVKETKNKKEAGRRNYGYDNSDWDLTAKGRKMLQKHKDGKSGDVTYMNATVGIKPHADWSKDETPARAAATPAADTPAATPRATTPRAAGTQSKSVLALQKFKDHVDEKGSIPTRKEFIAYMEEEPFSMSKSGAQTYYYTTKKKYANLNESVIGSLAQLLIIEPDLPLSSFGSNIFG